MEVLSEKIKRFLSVNYDFDHRFGSGDGYDDGPAYGCGDGCGSGYDYGCGSGYGPGEGSINGNGFGHDGCFGSGDGSDDGSGYGSGDISGCYDDGSGDDYDIKEFNSKKVYSVDGVPTLIYSIHGDYAKGAFLRTDLTLKPCYIAKVGDYFAHGETLKEARMAALEKSFIDMPEEQRIDAFLEEHPDKSQKYSYDDLFHWHNILTGSCEMGRREFCKERGITEKDSFTIKEFCEITKDSYGGNIIKQLENSLKIAKK